MATASLSAEAAMAKKRAGKKPSTPLSLFDSAGKLRILLGLLGPDEAPTLQMHDAAGNPRLIFWVDPDGGTGVSLLAPHGQPVVHIGASNDGGVRIGITLPSGQPILSVDCLEGQELGVAVFDRSGQPVWQSYGSTKTTEGFSTSG
jgi:hypothetical protein